MTQNIRYIILTISLVITAGTFAQTTTAVKPFDKIIVSPHIQATYVEGSEESVTVQSSTVDTGKIHIEVNNKTLRVYLEGAKDIEKNEKDYSNGYKETHSIYNGTVLTVLITYKTLHELSLRGDEKHLCQSTLTGDHFTLKVYGESDVTINDIKVNELSVATYGECKLTFLSGSVSSQKYTAYGEGKINSLAVSGKSSTITAYGEADFTLNVSDEIKMTAFGETRLHYKGDSVLRKVLQIGKAHIERIDGQALN